MTQESPQSDIFFLDKPGERTYQEEAPTSQPGWHPGEPPSYAAKLKILLKKGGKICTRGGTRPKLSKQERKFDFFCSKRFY
jgi:hypothetical protein